MEKEFIPYEQALALKELGFDERQYAFYNKSVLTLPANNTMYTCNSKMFPIHEDNIISAPLYQQAFSFFREKYKLYPEIGLHDREDEETWRFTISILGYYELAYNQNVGKEPYHKTYEEAESACLDKLIEIIKNR
jgi:hypothetical protein